MSSNKIDQIFKAGLEGHKLSTSGDGWSRLEAMIESRAKKRRRIVLYSISSVAAAILILLGVFINSSLDYDRTQEMEMVANVDLEHRVEVGLSEPLEVPELIKKEEIPVAKRVEFDVVESVQVSTEVEKPVEVADLILDRVEVEPVEEKGETINIYISEDFISEAKPEKSVAEEPFKSEEIVIEFSPAKRESKIKKLLSKL